MYQVPWVRQLCTRGYVSYVLLGTSAMYSWVRQLFIFGTSAIHLGYVSYVPLGTSAMYPWVRQQFTLETSGMYP